MALLIHVNGEAAIYTGTGAANALEQLGISVDGVRIELTEHTSPVHTDTFGGTEGVPFDEQQMLEDAIIRLQLVFYDEAVLAKIRGRGGATEGIMPSAGVLWGAGANYKRLVIKSPIEAHGWNFPSARLRGAAPFNKGTKRTVWDLEFYAVPYTGTAGTSAGAVLYNHTIV